MRLFANSTEIDDDDDDEIETENGNENVDAKRLKRRAKKRKALQNRLKKKRKLLEESAQPDSQQKQAKEKDKMTEEKDSFAKKSDDSKKNTKKDARNKQHSPVAPQTKSFYDPFARRRIVITDIQPAARPQDNSSAADTAESRNGESKTNVHLRHGSKSASGMGSEMSPTHSTSKNQNNSDTAGKICKASKALPSSSSSSSDTSSDSEDEPALRRANVPPAALAPVRTIYDPFARKRIAVPPPLLPSKPPALQERTVAAAAVSESDTDTEPDEAHRSGRGKAASQPSQAAPKSLYDPFAKRRILVQPAAGPAAGPAEIEARGKRPRDTANGGDGGVKEPGVAGGAAMLLDDAPLKRRRGGRARAAADAAAAAAAAAGGDNVAATSRVSGSVGDRQHRAALPGGDAAKAGEAAAAAAAAAVAQKTILFVGQLPYDVAAATVRKHFAGCCGGTGPAVRVLTDKATGRGRGIAFVEFGSEAEAEKGLGLDGSVLLGR